MVHGAITCFWDDLYLYTDPGFFSWWLSALFQDLWESRPYGLLPLIRIWCSEGCAFWYFMLMTNICSIAVSFCFFCYSFV